MYLNNLFVSILEKRQIPNNIAKDIVESKIEMERIDYIKKCLYNIKYYINIVSKPDFTWSLNTFWDLQGMIEDLYENKDLLFEPWFEKYHRILFDDVTFNINYNLYVLTVENENSELWDEWFSQNIESIRENTVLLLEKLKKEVMTKSFQKLDI